MTETDTPQPGEREDERLATWLDTQAVERKDWPMGVEDVDNFCLAAHRLRTLTRELAEERAEVERLRELNDKYIWQVRDTCTRAESAEAEVERLRSLVEEAWREGHNTGIGDGHPLAGRPQRWEDSGAYEDLAALAPAQEVRS